MKPRYKTGDRVRLFRKISSMDEEYLGKVFTIASNYAGIGGDSVWYTLDNINIGFREDQLKKFSPSRTGKHRNKKGQFIGMGQKVHEVSMDFIDRKLRERAIEEESYSKQRNYQKILTKLDEIEKKIDKLGRKI